jgi:hypothetical protein
MAYASSPLMLAIDRRIFDIPLEVRLQARISDLNAWTKTILPITRLSISRRRTNSVPATETPVLTSLTRRSQSET